MRAQVGVQTRNIKISGTANGWGARILAVGFIATSEDGSVQKWRRGWVNMQGVEMFNVG